MLNHTDTNSNYTKVTFQDPVTNTEIKDLQKIIELDKIPLEKIYPAGE
jgi:hypothetical protein